MALAEIIRSEIKLVLEETFAVHHGMYTNRNTSLFETLEGVSAETASGLHGTEQETVAGHLFHMKFYIVVLQEYITGKRTGKTDWEESWVLKRVDEAQWKTLRSELKDEYERLQAFVDAVTDWEKDDVFSGMLAVIAHNAFHLGAIRELLSR